MEGLLTTRRNDANVNWKALTTQVDSLSVIPRDRTKEGMAEYIELLLSASKKAARQKMIKSTCLRMGESFGGDLPSTSVSVGDRGGDRLSSANMEGEKWYWFELDSGEITAERAMHNVQYL